MKQTTKYVGLDVHQATTVTVVQDESGRVIARPTGARLILAAARFPSDRPARLLPCDGGIGV
jgi:hypothetical protein